MQDITKALIIKLMSGHLIHRIELKHTLNICSVERHVDPLDIRM